MIILISFILIFISFSAKWIMNTLQFHYDISIYKKLNHQDFWNPMLSWDNKYTKKSKILTWLVKNSLVFLTDAWHLFQFIELNSYISIICLLISINTEAQIFLALLIKPIINYQITIFIVTFIVIRAIYSITNLIFYKNK